MVVEDNDTDFEIIQRLIKDAILHEPIYRCTDGDDVLDFMYHEGAYQKSKQAPRPAVILLDLNLPGTDGRQVLEQLKQDIQLQQIPVVIFTTSNSPQDIEFCYHHGANGYLVKPLGLGKLRLTIQAFVDYWLLANISPSVYQ